jgi:hypothetical protein
MLWPNCPLESLVGSVFQTDSYAIASSRSAELVAGLSDSTAREQAPAELPRRRAVHQVADGGVGREKRAPSHAIRQLSGHSQDCTHESGQTCVACSSWIRLAFARHRQERSCRPRLPPWEGFGGAPTNSGSFVAPRGKLHAFTSATLARSEKLPTPSRNPRCLSGAPQFGGGGNR